MHLMKQIKSLFLGLSFCCALPSYADQEASNIPYVKASEYGRCFVKAVPDDYYGTSGKTYFYTVGKAKDTLVDTLPWYSKEIYLACYLDDGKQAGGPSLIRMGPWARGHKASPDHLALAFYFKGKEVKRYSTLDIVGHPDKVQASVSHYQIFKEILGYRWVNGNTYRFDVRTFAGKILSFDPVTGALLP